MDFTLKPAELGVVAGAGANGTRQQRERFKWVRQEMIGRYFGRRSEEIDPSHLNLAFGRSPPELH